MKISGLSMGGKCFKPDPRDVPVTEKAHDLAQGVILNEVKNP